jgi:hypothetical protein
MPHSQQKRKQHGQAGAARRGVEARAMRRLVRAQAAFDRSQQKVALLHVKLHRAEEKLARRAERMESAQTAVTEATGPALLPVPAAAEESGADEATGAPAPAIEQEPSNG